MRTPQNIADVEVIQRVMGYSATRSLLEIAQAALEATRDDELEALWERAPFTNLFRALGPDGRKALERVIGQRAVSAWLGLPGSRTVATPATVVPASAGSQSPGAPGDARESSVPVAEVTPVSAVQMHPGEATVESPPRVAAIDEATAARPRPTLGELSRNRTQVAPGDRVGAQPPAVQRRSGAGAHDDAEVHAAAARGVATPSAPLPHRDGIQQSFGDHDISGIQAHTGPEAAASAADMGATAYATGGHVVLGNSTDLHTVAHEAAHVVQQRGGVQLKGGVGQAGDVYEQHADAVADAVVDGRSAEALLDQHASAARGGAHQAVQRREQNGPYAGNRPEPSSSTAAGYAIYSSANRIMYVGEAVEYRVAPPSGSSGHLQVRWQVINDATATSTPGIRATIDGPTDQLRWRLVARVPGMHVIKAWVSVDGQQVAEVTYQQQVVSDATFVPLSGTETAPLSTMNDFIALVRRIESAYAGLPWQDIVSRMRKERYPGPGGPYAGIKAAFTWDDLVDEQDTLPGLEVPPVAMADIAALRLKPSVTTNAGVRIDVGHILTGVDSFNFPGVSGVFATQGAEGPAAATWSGDVGSALTEWANGAPLDDVSVATKLRYYDRYASRTDMLGDVDALAVAHGPNLVLSANAPLSQRLEVFYQSTPAKGEHQRFHNFCRASHLNLRDNQLDATARARIREQILRFARAYNVAGSAVSGIMIAGGNVEDSSMARVERNVDWFADHFIAWINAGLLTEDAP